MRLDAKDAGHKQLGYRAATSHLLQIAAVLLSGVLSMLEATRHQRPLHGRAAAASFGIVYALQACAQHRIACQSASDAHVVARPYQLVSGWACRWKHNSDVAYKQL